MDTSNKDSWGRIAIEIHVLKWANKLFSVFEEEVPSNKDVVSQSVHFQVLHAVKHLKMAIVTMKYT